MKSVVLLAVCGVIAAGSVLSEAAWGIEAFKKEFEAKYVKKDPSTDAEKSLAAAVTKVKCNVCHVGTNKKMRNEYGKALDELLDKKTDAKDAAKIQDALDKVAGMKSNPKNPSSPTFGQLIEEGKLPGDEAAK
jgi:hypothetical protein